MWHCYNYLQHHCTGVAGKKHKESKSIQQNKFNMAWLSLSAWAAWSSPEGSNTVLEGLWVNTQRLFWAAILCLTLDMGECPDIIDGRNWDSGQTQAGRWMGEWPKVSPLYHCKQLALGGAQVGRYMDAVLINGLACFTNAAAMMKMAIFLTT